MGRGFARSGAPTRHCETQSPPALRGAYEVSAALGAPDATSCAVCGLAVDVGARRCRRCLTDLVAVPPVRHVEVARELRPWARVVRELRARLTWRSGLLTIAGSLILAAVARQVLPDEPPIAPSSVRSADAGPVGWSSARRRPGSHADDYRRLAHRGRGGVDGDAPSARRRTGHRRRTCDLPTSHQQGSRGTFEARRPDALDSGVRV